MRNRRSGLAALEYVLVLSVAIATITLMIWLGGLRIIRLVYEMVAVMLSWPFM